MDLSNQVFTIQFAIFFEDKAEISMLKFASIIQGVFSAMFTKEPQMLPLPEDAPLEIPRCIFEKEDKSASLAISLNRMDFKAGLKDGALWRNNVEVIAYTLIQVCESLNVGIKRLGLVIQTKTDTFFEEKTNGIVLLDDFKSSDEKTISWVNQKKISDKFIVNIFRNIQINRNNLEIPGLLTIDVNTHVDTPLLCSAKETTEILTNLMSEIEEKLKNVF
jgi:hypothetical protein